MKTVTASKSSSTTASKLEVAKAAAEQAKKREKAAKETAHAAKLKFKAARKAFKAARKFAKKIVKLAKRTRKEVKALENQVAKPGKRKSAEATSVAKKRSAAKQQARPANKPGRRRTVTPKPSAVAALPATLDNPADEHSAQS